MLRIIEKTGFYSFNWNEDNFLNLKKFSNVGNSHILPYNLIPLTFSQSFQIPNKFLKFYFSMHFVLWERCYSLVSINKFLVFMFRQFEIIFFCLKPYFLSKKFWTILQFKYIEGWIWSSRSSGYQNFCIFIYIINNYSTFYEPDI